MMFSICIGYRQFEMLPLGLASKLWTKAVLVVITTSPPK
jgi:hypothetical protein